ncbi:MAG: response regulator [Oscillospiraceae bacterium]|nr:response regulator [Oscillospiraceae bacterium]
MIVYYLITAGLGLINLLILIFAFENKKVNYYFMILMIIMAISNGGYLALGLSDTVEEAVLANKIAYIGGCFTSPIMIFLICSICKINLNKWFRIGIYTYCFIVYGMILTTDYNKLYYTSTDIDEFGNSTVLVNSYGPGHTFFYFILYGTIIIQIAILVYSVKKKCSVSRKTLHSFIMLEILNVGLFFIGRIINPELEVMPALYVFDGWIFLYVHYRARIYDVEENVAFSLEKKQKNGYILLDRHLNYLGCNKTAEAIFPKLAESYVDLEIRGIPKLEAIIKKIKDDKQQSNFTFVDNDKHYEGHINRIHHNDKNYGYMLEFIEDTEKWKYINLISAYNGELQDKVYEQTETLVEQQKAIKDLFVQTVTALSEAVDAKDRYTSGHSKRVAEYSRMLAARMGKTKEEQEEIYRAGLLHDIGKIRIPVEIINKAGKLNDEEYNIIKIHPVTGYHILRGISGSNLIAMATKYHHERYDGKGYPNGLEGEQIPEAARILGVADSYDAMTSNRSYRKALPQEIVRAEIEKGRGTQFDPDIADIMLQMIDEDKDYAMQQADSMQRRILTVDDERINHKLIERIMSDEPMYEIISVCSGKEALEVLDIQHFDLIMLDLMMPDMDGLETLREIRKKHQTPVVLMTGDKNLAMSTEFAALGCDDYVTKPFLPLLIKEVIYNMTERTTIENDVTD